MISVAHTFTVCLKVGADCQRPQKPLGTRAPCQYHFLKNRKCILLFIRPDLDFFSYSLVSRNYTHTLMNCILISGCTLFRTIPKRQSYISERSLLFIYLLKIFFISNDSYIGVFIVTFPYIYTLFPSLVHPLHYSPSSPTLLLKMT
jgi:hypothetical protein